MTFRAVIFDWRGTLVTALPERRWVEAALALLGREASSAEVSEIVAAIAGATARSIAWTPRASTPTRGSTDGRT